MMKETQRVICQGADGCPVGEPVSGERLSLLRDKTTAKLSNKHGNIMLKANRAVFIESKEETWPKILER
jgi:hypothetical protein